MTKKVVRPMPKKALKPMLESMNSESNTDREPLFIENKEQEFEAETIKIKSYPKTYDESYPTRDKTGWEIKDRTYTLASGESPLTYTLQSKHSGRYPLLWFDEKTGQQEELRYATNQNSCLVSEQKGQVTLGHIIFENGILNVPKEKQSLQKLLSIYHPGKGIKYNEFDPVIDAEDELEELDLELEASNMAVDMDIDQAESIIRVEVGSKVNKMSSREIRRDLRLFAKRNPSLFLELANDDNVQLRNIAIRATEANIIRLSQDQRTFFWSENDRKLMTVPFDEHPYSAMAAYFKTDEGIAVYRSIEKKLR